MSLQTENAVMVKNHAKEIEELTQKEKMSQILIDQLQTT